MSIEQWDEANVKETTVTLEQMDKEMSALREIKTKHAEAKAVTDALSKEKSAQEFRVIQLLEDAGKTDYIAEGIGKAKVVTKLSVATPKTPEEKRAFFNWLLENQGAETHDAYLSVNSNSLQTLVKNLTEEYAARGEVVNIDGLQPASSRQTLSFTKA